MPDTLLQIWNGLPDEVRSLLPTGTDLAVRRDHRRHRLDRRVHRADRGENRRLCRHPQLLTLLCLPLLSTACATASTPALIARTERPTLPALAPELIKIERLAPSAGKPTASWSRLTRACCPNCTSGSAWRSARSSEPTTAPPASRRYERAPTRSPGPESRRPRADDLLVAPDDLFAKPFVDSRNVPRQLAVGYPIRAACRCQLRPRRRELCRYKSRRVFFNRHRCTFSLCDMSRQKPRGGNLSQDRVGLATPLSRNVRTCSVAELTDYRVGCSGYGPATGATFAAGAPHA